jgi:4,5-DOPA dioxygenase extradiol
VLPSLFLAHGVPTLAFMNTAYTRFVKGLSSELPTPRAIVLITADSASGPLLIGAADRYEGIRAEYGLPDELSSVQYPARGDRQLASDIGILCSGNGISYQFDVKRTLDHRAWFALHLLYPRANVPVVTITISGKLVPEENYRIGRMLAPLRARGVLIVACGSTGHQLSRLSLESTKPERFAVKFDEWLSEHITVWHTDELFRYEERAPFAAEAVQRGGEAHLSPLFTAMGSADAEQESDKLHQTYIYGCLSLNAWKFGKDERTDNDSHFI